MRPIDQVFGLIVLVLSKNLSSQQDGRWFSNGLYDFVHWEGDCFKIWYESIIDDFRDLKERRVPFW